VAYVVDLMKDESSPVLTASRWLMSESKKGATTSRAHSAVVFLVLTGYWVLATGYRSYSFSKNSQPAHEM
jgi:hypothetical protein